MANISINFTEPSPPAAMYGVGYREVGQANYTFTSIAGPPPLLLTNLLDGRNWEGMVYAFCTHALSDQVPWAVDDTRPTFVYTLTNHSTTGQSGTVTWANKQGVSQSTTLSANQSTNICARQGSVETRDNWMQILNTGTPC